MTDAAPTTDPDEGRAAAAVVWLLYLLAIPSANILAVVGVIVAYAAKDKSSGWVRGHFDSQIALFWSSIVWFIVLSVAIIVLGLLSWLILPIPFLILAILAMLGLFIWFTVKSVFGLINVIQRRPA